MVMMRCHQLDYVNVLSKSVIVKIMLFRKLNILADIQLIVKIKLRRDVWHSLFMELQPFSPPPPTHTHTQTSNNKRIAQIFFNSKGIT